MQDIGNQLVISALGAWRDNLALELLREIRGRGGEVLDTRFSQLGDTMSANLLIGGNWSSIGKLETALPAIAQKLELQILGARTAPRGERADTRPYAAEINAPQQADLLIHISEFFTGQDIVIAELVCQDYSAGQTGANMVNIQLVALVPLTAQPPALREAFMDLCDDLNADGILDPIKS